MRHEEEGKEHLNTTAGTPSLQSPRRKLKRECRKHPKAIELMLISVRPRHRICSLLIWLPVYVEARTNLPPRAKHSVKVSGANKVAFRVIQI